MGIDFGQKNIGVSLSDSGGRIATANSIIKRKSDPQAIEEIKALILEHVIEQVVIGIPISDNPNPTTQEQRTLFFIEKLKKSIKIPINTWDESFTTKDIRYKKNIDSKSAALILQEFLDRKQK